MTPGKFQDLDCYSNFQELFELKISFANYKQDHVGKMHSFDMDPEMTCTKLDQVTNWTK